MRSSKSKAFHKLAVASSVAVGAVLISLGGPAGAQSVLRPSQTIQTAPRSVDMPAGVTAPASPRPNRVMRRPLPGPDDAGARNSRGLPTTVSPTQPATNPSESRAPARNCSTNSANGSAPSDVIGAVGPTNLVVATNTLLNVYNKTTCALVSSVTLDTLFASVGTEGYFDPQALWDDTTGRFIVTAESTFASGTDQNQSYAVSKDSTGTSWWVYKIPIMSGSNVFCVADTAHFWDYPHVGSVNGQRPQWMITGNICPGNSCTSSAVITIDKGPTLSGATATNHCYQGFSFGMTPTNVLDNNSIAYLLQPFSRGSGVIKRWALDTTADTLTATSDISVAAWGFPPDAAQPNGTLIDSVGDRFVAQTSQWGTNLWNIHGVANGSFAMSRFYRFSTTATTATFVKDLTTGSNHHVFNPSLAVNQGRAFVSASRTIPSDATNGRAAMLMFTGLNWADSGWVSDLVQTSTTQYTGSDCGGSPCRWGDNSSAQIDPSDNANGWGFNQLATGTSQFSWGTAAALETGTLGWTTVGVGNIDGNATADIIWRATNGVVAEWKMSGATPTVVGGQQIPLDWKVVAIGDFNGDGRSDLLWRYRDGTLAMWLMNADGTFTSTGVGQVDMAWNVVGTGKFFTGDARSDIVWRHDNGTVVIWRMNGAVVSGSFGLGQIPSPWSLIALGDFNGDGVTDMLWRHSSGALSEWQMNGQATPAIAANVPLGNIPTSWKVVGVGNFDANANARSGLLWRNDNGTVAIWNMNASGQIGSTAGGQTIDNNWRVAGVGDFDGSGTADILWRHMDGTLAIWFMNANGAIGSTSGLGIVPTRPSTTQNVSALPVPR